jgi:hypothetical protein
MTNNIDKQSFGEGGVTLVAADTVIPAGQYCALSFVGGGGAITTAFSSAEVPLLIGVQTTMGAFPDGYTIYTPFIIGDASTARIACPVILYKSL